MILMNFIFERELPEHILGELCIRWSISWHYKGFSVIKMLGCNSKNIFVGITVDQVFSASCFPKNPILKLCNIFTRMNFSLNANNRLIHIKYGDTVKGVKTPI